MSGERPPSPRQLPLDLPHGAAMTRADFLVGDANREAIALIDRWPDWPARVVFLTGPAGSGKSHLVNIWREASGGAVVAATGLAAAGIESLVAAGAVAVEDVDAGPIPEAALFHLLNRAAEMGAAALLTGRQPPTVLPLALPDLASRLRAARPVALAEPDNDLLRRVLVKLFADRQLEVAAGVVDYLIVRMERSLEAANRIVAELDRDSLATRRAVTRALASAALARAGAEGGADRR